MHYDIGEELKKISRIQAMDPEDAALFEASIEAEFEVIDRESDILTDEELVEDRGDSYGCTDCKHGGWCPGSDQMRLVRDGLQAAVAWAPATAERTDCPERD